ncbi:hypothetical protein XF30_13515 [Bradyrhizobium sp. SUTN9-2]|nr:hypothetical protein XF30_13515 [Bradyrhizobium sp. SUTN9-2]
MAAALEIPPNVRSPTAAFAADEARLDIRQANIVAPAICAQSDVVAAMAVDQDAVKAHLRIWPKVILSGRPAW